MVDSGQTEKAILLVDDEMLVLVTLRSELAAQLGREFRYEIAKDGNEGLEVIDELAEMGIHVVLVISDWLMPGMRGDEFILKVREQHPDIRTILLSGMVQEESILSLKDSGHLDGYFSKPWDGVKLAELCRKLALEEEGST